MTTTQDDTTGRRPLAGHVAVVTGASRGAGRGIAIELGAAGATVYVTGRSTRGAPAAGYERFLASVGLDAVPGTIDDTADEVTAAGGVGIPVRCDHTSEDDVAALFARVERGHGRLDVLVNNATGHHADPIAPGPFREQPTRHWEGMFDRGVRNHVLAARAAAPMLVRQRRGLVVTTTYWDDGRYVGHFYYDLAKATLVRLALGLAEELRPYGVTSLAVSPGFMRTELVLAAHRSDEARWRDEPSLARTETPRYVGRAVAALAADRDVHARTGGVYRVGDLAREYGFTDVDGRVVPPFAP